jgi:hypothetical protein
MAIPEIFFSQAFLFLPNNSILFHPSAPQITAQLAMIGISRKKCCFAFPVRGSLNLPKCFSILALGLPSIALRLRSPTAILSYFQMHLPYQQVIPALPNSGSKKATALYVIPLPFTSKYRYTRPTVTFFEIFRRYSRKIRRPALWRGPNCAGAKNLFSAGRFEPFRQIRLAALLAYP